LRFNESDTSAQGRSLLFLAPFNKDTVTPLLPMRQSNLRDKL